MRKYLFSSILQVSPNNDYFVELKELAQPLPDTLVNKYRDALGELKMYRQRQESCWKT